MNINTTSPILAAPSGTVSVDAPVPVSAPDKVETLKKARNQTPDDHRQAQQAKKDQENKLSAKELKEVASEINEIMDELQTSLGFTIREELGNQVVVEIKNRDTHELIKQIPSEELLAIKEKMEELTGLLLDHSV